MTKTFRYYEYDVPVDLALMTGAGPETFKEISDKHLLSLESHAKLGPEMSLLEIGCGIGRDAIPLTHYLTSGSYIGVDIILPSISWCRDNISKNSSNFSFFYLDILDQLHNPSGKNRSIDIDFEFVADKSIDLSFLMSVVTHMYERDIVHYLTKIKEKLNKSGIIYLSTFIYDDIILECARRTNITAYDLRFDHEISYGCRINNLEYPLGAIAFTMDKWSEMLSQTGLVLAKPIIRGSWSGLFENNIEGQDVLILRPY